MSAAPSGNRVIAFADFHRLPGDTPQRDTNLNPGEIITAVELPAKGFANELHVSEDSRPARHMRSPWFLSRSGSSSMATPSRRDASRSAASRTSRGAIRRPKLRCAGSLPMPRHLIARRDVLLRDAKGYAHNTFKIDLARRCIVRALTQAARGTPQSQSSKKII